MVDFHKLILPIIVILIVGGIASFFLAFGFYPKKNVNININGYCYEFLGSAFVEYKNLDAKKEMRILNLQYRAIEPSNALIPITFSGTKSEIIGLADEYNIEVVGKQQVGDIYNNNNYIDRYIVNGIITKPHFKELLDDLTLQDFNPSTKTILSSIGLQPNSYLTHEEGKEISIDANNFMKIEIQQMIADNHEGIKQAECRSKIQY
jgi:hypothetical protein